MTVLRHWRRVHWGVQGAHQVVDHRAQSWNLLHICIQLGRQTADRFGQQLLGPAKDCNRRFHESLDWRQELQSSSSNDLRVVFRVFDVAIRVRVLAGLQWLFVRLSIIFLLWHQGFTCPSSSNASLISLSSRSKIWVTASALFFGSNGMRSQNSHRIPVEKSPCCTRCLQAVNKLKLLATAN